MPKRQTATKSKRHADAGRANQGKTYNDVAQGRDNVTVLRSTVAATLADINTRVACVSAESDDISPDQRATANTPGWTGGDYKAGNDEAPEVFAAAFNADDAEFIPGLDDIKGPTLAALADIERETAAA